MKQVFFLLSLTLLLQACNSGGGGGGSERNSNTAPEVNTQTTEPNDEVVQDLEEDMFSSKEDAEKYLKNIGQVIYTQDIRIFTSYPDENHHTIALCSSSVANRNLADTLKRARSSIRMVHPEIAKGENSLLKKDLLDGYGQRKKILLSELYRITDKIIKDNLSLWTKDPYTNCDYKVSKYARRAIDIENEKKREPIPEEKARKIIAELSERYLDDSVALANYDQIIAILCPFSNETNKTVLSRILDIKESLELLYPESRNYDAGTDHNNVSKVTIENKYFIPVTLLHQTLTIASKVQPDDTETCSEITIYLKVKCSNETCEFKEIIRK